MNHPQTDSTNATRRQGTGRRSWHAAGWPALPLLAAAAALFGYGLTAPAPPPQPDPAQALTSAVPDPGVTGEDVTPWVSALPPAAPIRVVIPAIGVDAPLVPLTLLPDQHLGAPPANIPRAAGWYADGTPPGTPGTAVIAGHVDTDAGPAVFYNLGALKKGMTIAVPRADQTTAVFTIDAVAAYSATNFPTHTVYDPARRPELRLITCGAGYSRTRHSYLGNVVVYAHLTSHSPA
ncbi:class F sortase [Streptacidiphilus rugosus]|uniref:class F sortase n=1 Tax=Streptacidiphilus rugosus TaxID=405783 RepID=UPI000A457889|nr:class F sortase [Streptacidiphilus rugosus]